MNKRLLVERSTPFEFARRVVTDLFSMTPWPLEWIGAGVLWHYGSLFSSQQILNTSFRAAVDALMPNDAWGLVARFAACGLWIVCGLSLFLRAPFLAARMFLAVAGLIVWGTLCYSCWRADVSFAVWRVFLGYMGAQLYVAALLRARRRDDEAEPASQEGEHQWKN